MIYLSNSEFFGQICLNKKHYFGIYNILKVHFILNIYILILI